MARIIFIQPDGSRREIDAPLGITLMEAARQHGVQGVIAQCGGACACATCHVYVSPAWLAKLKPRDEMEEGMLENAWQPREDMEEAMLENAWQPHNNSRLSCQIQITTDLNGLQVTVPAQQAIT